MTQLDIELEMEEGADLDAAAKELREALGKVNGVEEVDAGPMRPRITGLEVVAAISLSIVVIKGVREATDEFGKLVASIRKLTQKLRGAKKGRAIVIVDGKRIPLDQLSDADLRKLTGKA